MNAILQLQHTSSNADWHQCRLAVTSRGVAVKADFFIDRSDDAVQSGFVWTGNLFATASCSVSSATYDGISLAILNDVIAL